MPLIFIMIYANRMTSHLSIDCMVAEWRLNGDRKGGFQLVTIQWPPVDWKSGTFQWPFSQFIFWKIKWRPTRRDPGMWDSKEKYVNHSAKGNVNTPTNIWFICSFSLNMYLELVLLFFYSFHNRQLSFKRLI